jgi:hypothetical protein
VIEGPALAFVFAAVVLFALHFVNRRRWKP